MTERVLGGDGASPGIAVGAARVLAGTPGEEAPVEGSSRQDEARRATAALDAAGTALAALASRLREANRGDEAELVETAVLIAGDPGLREDVLNRTSEGASAATALIAAADAQAAVIAGLDDATLATRADDVRSIGRRAARLAARSPAAAERTAGDAIVVAEDLGPADVAELDADVRGVALAGGAVNAHAAIVARSLGLPMVVGLGSAILGAAGPIIVDGDAGKAVLNPGPRRRARARAAVDGRARDHDRWLADRALRAETRDGHRVAVLANVVSAAEVAVAVGYGADGAGLIRTELAFLDAPLWPTQAAHRHALAPVLAALRGQTATVRALDFGGDKTPPFLAGEIDRGMRVLLRSPKPFAAQLRAVLDAGRDCRLRVLLPMVQSAAELEVAVVLLREAAADVGVPVPPLGAMVETPRAAAVALDLARRADFLSIGTNDLTCATLGVDRFASGDARPHHPRVLAQIARTVEAAHAAGRVVEVCGEAASDPLSVPLLIGLGVDELSVGAARVGAVRAWVRGLDWTGSRALAQRALGAADARAVEALVQSSDAAAQGLDGGLRVAAIGA